MTDNSLWENRKLGAQEKYVKKVDLDELEIAKAAGTMSDREMMISLFRYTKPREENPGYDMAYIQWRKMLEYASAMLADKYPDTFSRKHFYNQVNKGW